MQQSQGKFILFDIETFATWLNNATIDRVIKLIQNHHTWSPSYKHFQNNHFSLLKGMESAHRERGFQEIAQNLTTFPDGTLAVCRSLNTTPAGIKGANTNGICIENVGNFDINNDQMSNDQKDTIIKLNALLCKKFKLTPNDHTVVYHHWYDLNTGQRTNGTGSTKSCPGTNFFGGNTVADANTNFLPLITTQLTVFNNVQPIIEGQVLFTAKVVSEDALNVRIEPNKNGKKVTILNPGVMVNVYEEKGTWCRINPTESRWVNGKFLEKVS